LRELHSTRASNPGARGLGEDDVTQKPLPFSAAASLLLLHMAGELFARRAGTNYARLLLCGQQIPVRSFATWLEGNGLPPPLSGLTNYITTNLPT
jgi:hypothetical protein